MNRRGFFGRSLVALCAVFAGSSLNTAKLTPREPNWQVGDRNTFFGDSQAEDVVHVMRDGRKCIV